MSKGDAAHAAEHAHGIQHRAEPPAPQTVEQRVAALERRVAELEAKPVDAIALRELPAGFDRGEASAT